VYCIIALIFILHILVWSMVIIGGSALTLTIAVMLFEYVRITRSKTNKV
jgi:hypothetical protein